MLLDGPQLDFNLIYQPDYFDATLHWYTATAQETRWLTSGVTTLVFSADSRLTMSSAGDYSLQLYCYDSAILPPQSAHLQSVTISSSGRWGLSPYKMV
ncbi:HutD family protein [Salmonella enterica subsp. diarizonae]|nr:HutD family protein [Salmonella enterica subsp. diarizonae]ECF5952040.1 HutD family protein [Salmonella enterica subsp. diarizonae]